MVLHGMYCAQCTSTYVNSLYCVYCRFWCYFSLPPIAINSFTIFFYLLSVPPPPTYGVLFARLVKAYTQTRDNILGFGWSVMEGSITLSHKLETDPGRKQYVGGRGGGGGILWNLLYC